MQKRWIIALAVLLALAVGVLVFERDRQPTFEGKPISYWLDQLPSREIADDGLGYSIGLPGPVGTATEARWNRDGKRAFKALDDVGTNCLSILLARIQSKDIRFLKPVLLWAEDQQLVEPSTSREAYFRRGQGLTAFAHLGTKARAVTPQLINLTRNLDTNLQFAAWYALESVAPEVFHSLEHPRMALHSQP